MSRATAASGCGTWGGESNADCARIEVLKWIHDESFAEGCSFLARARAPSPSTASPNEATAGRG